MIISSTHNQINFEIMVFLSDNPMFLIVKFTTIENKKHNL